MTLLFSVLATASQHARAVDPGHLPVNMYLPHCTGGHTLAFTRCRRRADALWSKNLHMADVPPWLDDPGQACKRCIWLQSGRQADPRRCADVSHVPH